jgi:hypothetical protein
VLAAQGTTHTETARRIGVHYNTMAERMDEAAEEVFDTLTGLVRGARSETVQLKAVESVLDRSTVAPKRQIHSHSTVDIERREIHIVLTAADIAQLKLGDIDEDEIEGMIDVTPQPVRPVGGILAELQAAEVEHWDAAVRSLRVRVRRSSQARW